MEGVVPWDYNGADKSVQPVDIVTISNSCNMALMCLWGCWCEAQRAPKHIKMKHTQFCVFHGA